MSLGQNNERMSYLARLEAESIHIIREAVAQADNPVMLYSIGKDSTVMLHLARKAFFPAPLPFPLLHVDTTWKFKEMIQFRDSVAADPSVRLIVHVNPECVRLNINPFEHGSSMHTDLWKTEGLKQALRVPSTLPLAVPAEMKKSHAPKKESSRFEPRNMCGIRRTNVRSCGTSTTRVTRPVNQSECFHYPIGQN